MVLCEASRATKRSYSSWDKPLSEIETSFKLFNEPTISTTPFCGKDQITYQRYVDQYGFSPSEFTMIDNSLSSHVLPVVEIGEAAVQVPSKP